MSFIGWLFSVLTKGTSAEVQINIRPASLSGPNSRAQPIPLEPFSVNKEMGRILIRRQGETIAAGTLSSLLSSSLSLHLVLLSGVQIAVRLILWYNFQASS